MITDVYDMLLGVVIKFINFNFVRVFVIYYAVFVYKNLGLCHDPSFFFFFFFFLVINYALCVYKNLGLCHDQPQIPLTSFRFHMTNKGQPPQNP